MSCDVTKFSITKGSDNMFSFTIKQDNSTLPLVILTGDTFSAKLVLLGPDPVETAFTIETPSTGTGNALNGKIELVMIKESIDDLVSEVGDKVDRYYAKPTYKLIIDCVTANNGIFTAKIDEVYVNSGSSVPEVTFFDV